jgi:hypothetical protein
MAFRLTGIVRGRGKALPWQTVLIALALAVAADYFVFRLLDLNYFSWYVTNGALIQLLVAGVAVAVDLESEPKLVSIHPGEYLASCFAVVGISLLTVAEDQDPSREGGFQPLQDDPKKAEAARRRRQEKLPRSGPSDGLVAGLLDVALFALWLSWLVVIAPIQYFGNLIAGAPARLALASPSRIWVLRQAGVTVLARAPVDEGPEGAEEAGFAARPVALTASITAGLLVAISYLV